MSMYPSSYLLPSLGLHSWMMIRGFISSWYKKIVGPSTPSLPPRPIEDSTHTAPIQTLLFRGIAVRVSARTGVFKILSRVFLFAVPSRWLRGILISGKFVCVKAAGSLFLWLSGQRQFWIASILQSFSTPKNTPKRALSWYAVQIE